MAPKPRRKWFIAGCVLLSAILLMCFGSFLTWAGGGSLLPELNGVSSFQKFDLLIRVGTSLITSLGILLSFWKEEILRRLNQAEVVLEPIKDSYLAEDTVAINQTKPTGDKKGLLTAKRYHGWFRVKNISEFVVKNCSVQLERYEVGSPSDFSGMSHIDSRTPIRSCWTGREEHSIDIAPNGAGTITFLNVNAPEDDTEGEGATPGILVFGETVTMRNGQISLYILVHADNIEPRRFVLQIDWDGTYHMRLSEMKGSLKIKVNNNLENPLSR